MNEIILKKFEDPDEIRHFEKGKFEIVKFDGMTIGRATYRPGWKWSVDVSPLSGTDFCEVEHLGMVLSGQAACAFMDGEIHTLRPGTLFYIGGSSPHDSWVVGDEEYVSLHFEGAEKYAN
jgi:hypothetical protein